MASRHPRGCARATLAAALCLAAVSPVGAGEPFSGRSRELAVRSPRLDAAVLVDGVLDEAVWSQAARLTDFSQYAPVDGRSAEHETEVLVWYSPTAIYFGIRATANPATIRATLADRDRINEDDHVQLYLGTFDDGRQALMFAVNPLGVQADGALVEGLSRQGAGFGGLPAGREATDLSPDYVFDSKGRLTDTGYDVEVRIPFKSLRYQSSDPQDWGLHVIRRVQSTGHEDSWVPAQRAAASFLAQSGKLVGLTDLRRGLVLDLNPVLTTKIEGSPGPGGGGWEYDPGSPEFGGNVRWGITPNLTLNGTINPDFSQVEADAGQFQFDPREAVFFEEKRPFFLDSIELFSTPNDLIYTRRIVAPLGAAKVTGKVSGTTVALLSAVDDTIASSSGDDHPVFNILRVQRDLGGASKAALVYTDRVDAADSNRVAATDARFTFRDIYTLAGQAAVSRTEEDGVTTTAPLWQASLNRSGRRYGLSAELFGVDDEFRAEAGFVRRYGIANVGVTNQLTLYGRDRSALERWTGDARVNGRWKYDDFVAGRGALDRQLHLNSNFTFRGGWTAGQSVLIETFGYDEELYEDYALLSEGPEGPQILPFVGTPQLDNLDFVLSLGTPRVKGVSVDAFVLWGQDENFFEWASADILFASLTVQWRPTEKLRVDGVYRLQSYQRRTDGSTVGDRLIPRLKVEYQVTRAIFLRVVSQYDEQRQDDLRDDSRTNLPIVIRDPDTGVYERALGYSSSSLRTDFLFSYQPTPGTVVFVGYGNTLADDDQWQPPGRQRTADGFFAKVSYLFRL